MKNEKEIKFMRCVAKELIRMPIDDDTLDSLYTKFYEIMRKYGIKEGTKLNNGIQKANFEWSMCKTLFIDSIQSRVKILDMIKNTPEDLQCYD